MTSSTGPHAPNLASTYLRLRAGASVEALAVDDSFWERIAAGGLGTFHHEYLVSCHAFESDWAVWEMHPHGDEVVCLLDGAVTFVLEGDGGERTVALRSAGDFLVVPAGTWHTARAAVPARVLFITAGEGTQHRPAGDGGR